MKEKQILPEGKEITIKLGLGDAKECLKYLPANLKRIRSEIEEAIEGVNFWNFLRNCECLEFTRADFHLTGLMTPGWHLYCKHPENKMRTERLAIEDISEEVKDKITSGCDKESCPIKRKK